MRCDSLKALAIVASLFFFTNSLSSSFLPVYYQQSGLSIPETVELLFFTFVLIGFLPMLLLRVVKNFERVISFGIVSTLLFYVVLILYRNPIVLGLAYGLSIATFWPSFNLLQFRLSESRVRARTVSLFGSVIPSLAGIAGPAIGGFIIQNFGFTSVFVVAIILYSITSLVSSRVRFQAEGQRFSIPRSRAFAVFFFTFILLGLSEAYWLGYPLFVSSVSGTVFNMGIVLALSATMIAVIAFLVNWLSDIKRTRISFAIIGASLNAAWCFAISTVSQTYQIVALSLLSGLAGAFSTSWFAHYADSFRKEDYASILVLMETGLMIGRISNLAPTYVFVSASEFANYFRLLGAVLLCLVPVYALFKSKEPKNKTSNIKAALDD